MSIGIAQRDAGQANQEFTAPALPAPLLSNSATLMLSKNGRQATATRWNPSTVVLARDSAVTVASAAPEKNY